MAQTAEGEQLKEPTEDQIRERAYQVYLARGGAPGNAVEDWLMSENMLRWEATVEKCPAKLEDDRPCPENLVGKDEPLIHHAMGGDEGIFTHYGCKLGHAWHRHIGNGLITPCDCTGHARAGF
jgi:hypothetical protein